MASRSRGIEPPGHCALPDARSGALPCRAQASTPQACESDLTRGIISTKPACEVVTRRVGHICGAYMALALKLHLPLAVQQLDYARTYLQRMRPVCAHALGSCFWSYLVERRRVDEPSFIDATQRCAIVDYLRHGGFKQGSPASGGTASCSKALAHELGPVTVSVAGRACGRLTRMEGRTKE